MALQSTTEERLTPLARRVRGEFAEMPGLRLTVNQAARLFNLDPQVADAVLNELQQVSVLRRAANGGFALISESELSEQSLRNASLDRLLCFQRHWTWADEAMARFDRESAGWDYDDAPMSDHPFGAYYHWCALLCALGEAALEHGLLPSQLGPVRGDIEASLPGLRACRDRLVVVPASLRDEPLIMNLLRDKASLDRLRRVHEAVGEALRNEQASREIESLDPEGAA